LPRLAACFHDDRDPARIEHTVEQLIRQRVFALALGYEDLQDHDSLRHDPLLSLLTGKAEPGTTPLAGKSTLNRLELTRPQAEAPAHRYQKILFDPESADRLLVQLFVESQATAPESLVLDLEATDDPLHEKQEGRFFHGYYGHYCYLPLYVFCGDHLLCARLRTAPGDASAGALGEIQRIVRTCVSTGLVSA
jgi:Transposase DDE domain group 1